MGCNLTTKKPTEVGHFTNLLNFKLTKVLNLVTALNLVGFVNNEAHRLTLFDIVETDHPNVGTSILRAAFPNFG
jgi:hypothetical protein